MLRELTSCGAGGQPSVACGGQVARLRDIECDITTKGQNEGRLRWFQRHFSWLGLGRPLRFYVASCKVPQSYWVLCKVRNVGIQVEQRNIIREPIASDTGHDDRIERADFPVAHFVECFTSSMGAVLPKTG
jgi:hypothetical protein